MIEMVLQEQRVTVVQLSATSVNTPGVVNADVV